MLVRVHSVDPSTNNFKLQSVPFLFKYTSYDYIIFLVCYQEKQQLISGGMITRDIASSHILFF